MYLSLCKYCIMHLYVNVNKFLRMMGTYVRYIWGGNVPYTFPTWFMCRIVSRDPKNMNYNKQVPCITLYASYAETLHVRNNTLSTNIRVTNNACTLMLVSRTIQNYASLRWLCMCNLLFLCCVILSTGNVFPGKGTFICTTYAVCVTY
jgi:hypothetical protein